MDQPTDEEAAGTGRGVSPQREQHRHRLHRPLILRLSYHWLLVVPALLTIGGIATLIGHSDYNIFALYSQCHAHAQLPALSRVRVVGPPACFAVSVWEYALSPAPRPSLWGRARAAAILAFVAGLLTTALVESARLANRPSRVAARPTAPWLVFSLVPGAGGPLVWPLVLVPAFLRRAKDVQARRESVDAGRVREADAAIDRAVRALASQVEALAVPAAVAVGFVVPSLAMLVTDHPVSVAVWLFFPLWVAAVRYVVKLVGIRTVKDPEPYHLESHRLSLIGVYALPILCSVVAHGLLMWSLFSPDDRREMTRSTMRFLETEMGIVGITVLYWLLVEAGVLVSLAFIALSVLLGPGAGLCVSWILREKAIENYPAETGQETNGDATRDERTPLLQ